MLGADGQDRRRGAFIGLAVGDALGAAVEFGSPGSFAPVTGYRNGGPHRLEAARRDMLDRALQGLIAL
jgi:ADP-ribosyl-[dinitrogen reductase] hydrolase